MVTLDELGVAINDLVGDYVDNIVPKLEKKLDETANSIVNYITTKAPRSGSSKAFADSFVATPKGSGLDKTIVIYSNTKGKLTHLLEFGFTHRNGKFVRAKPFMRPAYDEFTPKMLEDIKRIIEKGN